MQLSESESKITSQISMEHVPAGQVLPKWLLQHLVDYVLKKATSSRIMILYPNEASRRNGISKLRNQLKNVGHPIESTLHLTIPRLFEALQADLRLPRTLSQGGCLAEITHQTCVSAAKDYYFPILHPNPEEAWPRSKTRRLSSLQTALEEEDLSFDWDGDPGLDSYQKVLKKIENKLDRAHPGNRIKRILVGLAKLDTDTPPFTLESLTGIVMLDHLPSLSWARLEILRQLSNFVPIHQLVNPGSFRLGQHGAFIEDLNPCRSKSDLPPWVPKHEPWKAPGYCTWQSPQGDARGTEIHRLMLQSPTEIYSATLDLLQREEIEGDKITIVDPMAISRKQEWEVILEEVGLYLSKSEETLTSIPCLHWLLQLICLPHGDDAWSFEQLRSLARQSSLLFKKSWLHVEPHPTERTWSPRPHVEVLEEIARGFHLTGGPGALDRWLYTLKSSRFEHPYVELEIQHRMKEETQWWLLCLAKRLYPLLSEYDQKSLTNSELLLGCATKQQLQLPNSAINGDEWLNSLIEHLSWEDYSDFKHNDGNAILGLNRLIQEYAELKEMQSKLNLKNVTSGYDWVELIKDILTSTKISLATRKVGDLELLTPNEALGTESDLLIFIDPSSSNWNMSMETIPWLDDETKLDLGVLRPDQNLRDGRHALRHLLNCASRVLILDASIDESIQLATPLSEWIQDLSKEDITMISTAPKSISSSEITNLAWEENYDSDMVVYVPTKIGVNTKGEVKIEVRGPRRRDSLQNSGQELLCGGKPVYVPMSTSIPLLRWDAIMMEDRIFREPILMENDEPYLNKARLSDFVSLKNITILPSKKLPSKVPTPRLNAFWPVIGTKINHSTRSTTIDPRPLQPKPSGVEILDQRMGHLNKPVTDEERPWSPSRLKEWMDCPRKAWLSQRIQASLEESLGEGLDARARGDFIHKGLAELQLKTLNFEEGIERDEVSPANLATCGMSPQRLMAEFLSIVLQRGTWLTRPDAVAVHRRKEMTQMSLSELDTWQQNKPDIEPQGRLGRLLLKELENSDSALIAIEWQLDDNKDNIRPQVELPSSIAISGYIDRVELVPHQESGEFVNDDYDVNIVPLDIDINQSVPARRLVIIRDIKTMDGPKPGEQGKRHREALFDEVQLALYARAWEVTHPGDRVVAVGISEVGEKPYNLLEIDPEFDWLKQTTICDEFTDYTYALFRREEESNEPSSNPFRAWLSHRLSVAAKTVQASIEGSVHPTPSAKVCNYCRVAGICGLGSLVGGEDL